MRQQRISQLTVVFGICLVLLVVFSVLLPGFSSVGNILGLLQNVSILGILSLGMAIVVIGRGIDISMVAALAVPAGLVLQMVENGYPVSVACIAALALALTFGLVNGWMVAYAEVPSLFTSLASGLFLAGLGQVAFFRFDVVQWSAPLDAIAWIGSGGVLGVPMSVIVFGIACGSVAIFLNRLRFGAYVYALGDNPLAARITGISTRPVVLLQYVLAATMSALAGLVMAASINSMPTRIFNSTLIYEVILVVVLGGIGLSGGRGGVLNVIVGTLTIGTLLNGMTILNMSYSVQNLIKGVILLAAVLIDSILNPRNEETAQQGDI